MGLSNLFYNVKMIILSLPKTIYINFKYLPVSQAVKFPIVISYRIKIEEFERTKIQIVSEEIKCGMIRLGVSRGSFYLGHGGGVLHLNGGEIYIKGKVAICGGFSLILDNGHLVFGKNFFANANLLLNCSDKVIVGDDIIVGWNCSILDGNGHKISKTIKKNHNIEIADNTWLASEVAVLNGSKIGKGSVVAFRSVVHDKFDKEHVIISGNPGKIVKENINWEV